ncbi:MAG: ATP-binding cassette domain-containing protein [Bacteroides sp.]|nr:ATP-binding cassette domain-containing protein [Bacteroides sp.]
MSILIQKLTYKHTDQETLFEELSFVVEKSEKVALLGNNGTGKSTLLRLVQGELKPVSGRILLKGSYWYVPQQFGQYESCTVAQALGVAVKTEALHQILEGAVTEENLSALEDDWEVEERAVASLAYWGLEAVGLQTPFRSLSGGERTLVFLAGINLHDSEILLLDEPTNHIDCKNREKLYNYIPYLRAAILVVSHDRMLLEQLPLTMELTKSGIKRYGGSYSFYKEQKEVEEKALEEEIRSNEKMLKQARRKAQKTAEKKQKQEARGKKQVRKSDGPRILNNALQDKADKSSARMQGEHTEKIGRVGEELSRLRLEVPDRNRMKIDLGSSGLYAGKILLKVSGINFSYPEKNRSGLLLYR